MPERPSCIIPAAIRHRFGSLAGQQAGRFCGMDRKVPEKEFFARRGRKSPIPLQTGAREGVMQAWDPCPDQNFLVRHK